MPKLPPTGDERHDAIIERIEREMEDEARARIAELYAPPKPVAPASVWKAAGDGAEVMEIAPKASGLTIHGLASTSTLNSHGYALLSWGMSAELPVPLLWSHKGHGSPIGEVFHIRRTSNRVYVRAQLFDNEVGDYAARLITSGHLRGFSGAANQRDWRVQGIVGDKTFYDKWRLQEVSLCEEGANPDCWLDVFEPGDSHEKFFVESSASPLPNLNYKGVWSADRQYYAGQYVTRSGSLWHASVDSKAVEPGTAPACWVLTVKRGKAEALGQ